LIRDDWEGSGIGERDEYSGKEGTEDVIERIEGDVTANILHPF